jgi:hypothetical protein
MANKKRQQTINKRNRERAVEEKRTLKRERKQAEREAARTGEPSPFDVESRPVDGITGEATPADEITGEAPPADGITPESPPADGVTPEAPPAEKITRESEI